MLENAMEQITKIYFKEKTVRIVSVINFWIEELEYYIRFKNDNNLITPELVVHYKGYGVCPFCKKHVVERGPCYAFVHSKEDLHALFQYLTNHSSVRLKLVSLGLTPKGEKEKR